ncbi:MAG TPA: dolichyl-phosphate beta-glucosyltransferase [Blastocatellia bacterium]|nr:dolichyl-phosphate beta-glucosyltransferase [Blastocatellia bacterium]
MACFLSIIIPAYNEEKRIGLSLDDILRFLGTQPYHAEVVVVDDGSSDQTAQFVSERASRFRETGNELRVLTNSPNRGKGYSVKRGLTEASGEIVLFTDADLSSPITEAPKLIDPIAAGRADVVFGSRALKRELIGVHQPRMREFGGSVFNLFMRTITGLNFKDTQCGFKAFRRELALPVFRLQSIDRFGFDPEVLYIARKRGLRLLEVPVVWNHCEGGELQSKLNYVRDSLNMFADLIRIRLNDLVGRYKNSSAGLQIESKQPTEPATKTGCGA